MKHSSWAWFIAVGSAWSSSPGAWASYPALAQVRARYASSESWLLDRNGVPLQERRAETRFRRLSWTPLAAIAESLKRAVIVSEDRRFESHHGVDWIALAVSGVKAGLGAKSRGASTLSMQLASLLDSDLRPRAGRRGWQEKLKQVEEARALEAEWSKGEILEAYLNLISFRGELQGVASASRGLFGKAPHGLSEGEAVILASLIRSPGAAPAGVERRACQLAEAMARPEACAEARQLLAGGVLAAYLIRPEASLAEHAAARIDLAAEGVASGGSLRRSTLEAHLQTFVDDSLKRHVLAVRDRNVRDGAVLVVDNVSGEVLSYVGGTGRYSSATHVDGVRALRQAGSTLKPFLYALALQNRYLTASSKLEDSPADVALESGAVYRPRNYDHRFHGSDVTLRSALGSSLNVPAVRTLQLVGVDSFARVLRDAGLGLPRPSEDYGPSLALGSADISLWDLVNAYRTLAQGGMRGELTLNPSERSRPRRRRVFSKAAAFVVSDILSDRAARAMGFGLENVLSLRFWAAAKTGTSKDMRDNWCVGFSERYTVGVWVGNFSGEPMWDVSGITGAGPVWAEVMDYLHATRPSRAPPPPRGVIRSGGEWYLAGTEPRLPLGESKAAFDPVSEPTRITYPSEGMQVARDPDIPEDLQRLNPEAAGLRVGVPLPASVRWRLNGAWLDPSALVGGWKVGSAGNYLLELVGPKGVIDTVHFSVRGG